MKAETYEIEKFEEDSFFIFASTGPQGVIAKFVWIQSIRENLFNLAFGDLNQNGGFDDKVVSNNNDTGKVIATVARCALEFVKTRRGCKLSITPVDDRRARLYNYVFRNRHIEFGVDFII